MRTTKAFLCLLAVVLLAACNDYDGEDPTSPNAKRELTFTFPNTATGSTVYAIATPNENELRTVDVYVFALDELSTESPQPYLLEDIHQSGIGDFNLNPESNDKKATISLAKGKKKKFFFVGNGRDHVSAKDVTLNVTRADDFLEKVTKVQQGHIAAPLLMSDLIDMPDVDDIVKNNGGQATVELTRRVVRFDVVNDADESDFIIEEIRIKDARAAVNLFADNATAYDAPSMDETLSLDFTMQVNANHGLSNSVFYTYPTYKAGEMTLELIGKDASTGNPQVYPVTMQDKQGSDGTPFNIEANSRYTINVLSKGIGYLNAILIPEEWGYDPDNDVKVSADYGIIKLRDENGDEFQNNGIELGAEPTTQTAATLVKVTAESEWELYIAPEYADWIGVTDLQTGEIHDEFEVWTKQANPSKTDVREGVVEVRNKIRPSIMQPFIVRQAKNDNRSISYSGAFISNGMLSISGEIVTPVTIDVQVSDGRPWTAEAIKFKDEDPDMDWIDLNGTTYAQQTGPVAGNGKLQVALHANPADTVRQAYIKITQEAQSGEEGDLICKIPVYQSPSNLGTIRLDAAGLKNDTLSVTAVGFSDRDGKRNIRVFAHTEWKVEASDTWITISDKTFENGYNGSFKVSVERNIDDDSNDDRIGEIRVTNTVNPDIEQIIKIEQKKLEVDIPSIDAATFNFPGTIESNWDEATNVYDFTDNADGKSFSFIVKSAKITAYDFKLLYDVTGVSVGLDNRDSQAYRNLIKREAATDDADGKKLQKYTITIPKQADDRRVPIDIQIFIRNSESYNYYQMITLSSRPDYYNTSFKPVKVGGIFWAPVNVGQTDLAGSTTPFLANWGYHFQYGRNKGFDPGKTDYENEAGPVSYASVQEPSGENKDKFIENKTGDGVADWLDRTNTDDLAIRNAQWSKAVNNSPCPKGWRVPEVKDMRIILNKLTQNGTIQDYKMVIGGDETGETLFLPLAKYRSFQNVSNINADKTAYWTSTGLRLNHNDSDGFKIAGTTHFANGTVVRCVQE